MWSIPSFLSLPDPFEPGVVALDRGLSMGQIELNSVLMRNWIVWNRTVFDIETVFTLNWIGWNRTFLTKPILILNWIVCIRTVWLSRIAWNRNVFDI